MRGATLILRPTEMRAIGNPHAVGLDFSTPGLSLDKSCAVAFAPRQGVPLPRQG